MCAHELFFEPADCGGAEGLEGAVLEGVGDEVEAEAVGGVGVQDVRGKDVCCVAEGGVRAVGGDEGECLEELEEVLRVEVAGDEVVGVFEPEADGEEGVDDGGGFGAGGFEAGGADEFVGDEGEGGEDTEGGEGDVGVLEHDGGEDGVGGEEEAAGEGEGDVVGGGGREVFAFGFVGWRGEVLFGCAEEVVGAVETDVAGEGLGMLIYIWEYRCRVHTTSFPRRTSRSWSSKSSLKASPKLFFPGTILSGAKCSWSRADQSKLLSLTYSSIICVTNDCTSFFCMASSFGSSAAASGSGAFSSFSSDAIVRFCIERLDLRVGSGGLLFPESVCAKAVMACVA